MIQDLLRDTRIERVAVAVGIAIVIGKRNAKASKAIYTINNEKIIDVDLTNDIVNRVLEHKILAFTNYGDTGLILLNDVLTDEISKACSEHRELISDTVNFVSKIRL